MADKKDNIAQWDAMQKQRMEKDLTELQSLIQKHFEQRTVDDASLSELTDRIEKRKLQRTVSELCSEIQSVFSRNEKFEKPKVSTTHKNFGKTIQNCLHYRMEVYQKVR